MVQLTREPDQTLVISALDKQGRWGRKSSPNWQQVPDRHRQDPGRQCTAKANDNSGKGMKIVPGSFTSLTTVLTAAFETLPPGMWTNGSVQVSLDFRKERGQSFLSTIIKYTQLLDIWSKIQERLAIVNQQRLSLFNALGQKQQQTHQTSDSSRRPAMNTGAILHAYIRTIELNKSKPYIGSSIPSLSSERDLGIL